MEVELTEWDYRAIWELAHREYIESAMKNKQTFVCRCYTKAFCHWLASKNLVIIDGKIMTK